MGNLASNGGGPGLVAAGLPRVVEGPDGQTFRVRPPSVRDALELIEALQGAVLGDADDELLVQEVMERWLPPDVYSLMGEIGEGARAEILKALIYQGVDLSALRDRSKAGDKAERPDAAPNWTLLLSDYCQLWSAEPWRVYSDTPFPVFLTMLASADAASARELLRWAEIEVIPHLGKGASAALSSLRRRALAAGKETDSYGACAPDDVIKRDRAELREMMGGGA